MKKFAYVVDGKVNIIIDEFNKDFPNVPLEERYSKDFLEKCVECGKDVREGMEYNSETGEFIEHKEEVENVEE